ncbi:M20/M25/M40 family metallo-hydrolase [Elioraea rosea]|uniref:M20/M25/M40 family metallo-hydrolase n=1 Tax=Elioraea rosea TaxID=2492390 RepID=UPI0013159C78|nr:M20/M25/M40 family metallo-hydrolase [Elioraea rosea]
MTDPKTHEAALAPLLPEILAMTERVVSIDSGTYDAAGVNAVIDVWAGMLSGMGFTVERTPLPGRGDQMTATLSLGNGPRLLVLGHADTVWPAGTVAQWPFKRDGDRITGPGVGDMKTNVVMALHTIRHLLGAGLKGLGSITVLIVPDEEIGSPQSRGWIESHAREADLCLTLEPCRPNGGVVVGRGAVGALYVTATGVTAHCGSYREMGASAVSALAALVAEFEALTDASRGLAATVGIFRGGAARQVVPGEAEIHLDLRAPDKAGADELLAKARAIAERKPQDGRVSVTVTGGFGRPPFPTTPGTRLLYSWAEEACKALGQPIHEVVARGGSDGSFAAGLGVPTLDGLGAVAHDTCSRRETVEVSSIIPRSAVIAHLIASAAAGRKLA